MTPVVRISDHTFRKLQQLSEPLVDTPSSVVERLIDYYLSHEKKDPTLRNDKPASVTGASEISATTANVFLVPANAENIRATIEQSVRLQELNALVSPKTIAQLTQVLGDRKQVHCWAMTESSRGTFDYMRQGDIVLITVKDSGLFSFRGRVIGKIENEELGRVLWPVQTARPWSLIYFLDDIHPIAIAKERLVSEFGYNRSYRVYGVIRVNPERVAAAVSRHESMENILQAATE